MTTLLDRVRSHLDDAGLTDGFTVRFFRWSDEDFRGSGNIMLFRDAGTSGPSDYCVQYPDVIIQAICSENQALFCSQRMREVIQLFRSNWASDSQTWAGRDVIHFQPVGPVLGPSFFDNGRARFELTVRCIVSDH